jgi:hypothetical protein
MEPIVGLSPDHELAGNREGTGSESDLKQNGREME